MTVTYESTIEYIKNAKLLAEMMLNDNPKDKELRGIVEKLELAIDALEKQIPKKPKDTEFGGECAVCGSVVELGDNFARINCCPWCSQKIDWSEEK